MTFQERLWDQFADEHTKTKSDLLFECRHCGYKSRRPTVWCRTCGSIEIARYTFATRDD